MSMGLECGANGCLGGAGGANYIVPSGEGREGDVVSK